MSQFLEDVASFNQRPQEVSDELVSRIKVVLRKNYDIPDIVNILIGPTDKLTDIYMKLTDTNTNSEIFNNIISCLDFEQSPTIDPPESDTTIFSTDPNFLINKLKCDGACGCTFNILDLIYTNGNEDYCLECSDRLMNLSDNFRLLTVSDRLTQYAQEQMSSLMNVMGLPFELSTQDNPSGS